MNRNKQLILTWILGFMFIVISLFTERFLVIKPNRIVESTAVSIDAVIKDFRILFTAVFVILIVVILFTFIYKRYWYLSTAISLLSILLLFYMIGNYAISALDTYSNAARVSPALGFWLYLLGLVLILNNTCLIDGKSSPKRYLLLIILFVIGLIFMSGMGLFDTIGIVKELNIRIESYRKALLGHLILTLSASSLGLVLSVYASYISYKHDGYKRFFKFISNGAQVIPTLSMLGLLMIPLTFLAKQFPFLKSIGISGIGFFPAFLVLTSYTWLPIINQSLSGFDSIPRSVINSAEAMGMKASQVFWKVELPMALPSILSGFKVALIQTTANAVLAGLVGGGGLGALLFLGLAQSAVDLVSLSALSVVMIALLLNGILSVSIYTIEEKRGLL